jgi:hypothetical protein
VLGAKGGEIRGVNIFLDNDDPTVVVLVFHVLFPLRVSWLGCECHLKTMFCNNALYYSICFGYGHVSVGCELACYIFARSSLYYECAAV